MKNILFFSSSLSRGTFFPFVVVVVVKSRFLPLSPTFFYFVIDISDDGSFVSYGSFVSFVSSVGSGEGDEEQEEEKRSRIGFSRPKCQLAQISPSPPFLFPAAGAFKAEMTDGERAIVEPTNELDDAKEEEEEEAPKTHDGRRNGRPAAAKPQKKELRPEFNEKKKKKKKKKHFGRVERYVELPRQDESWPRPTFSYYVHKTAGGRKRRRRRHTYFT
jgi:hypothetical protein